jgi:Ras-related protein Rab-6A
MEVLSTNTITMMKFKIVFLGNVGVGKTSIISRFIYGGFEASYCTTIGVDYVSKTLQINETEVRY